MRNTTATKTNLEQIIALHASMKGCYFYTPPCGATGRRAYEKNHSLTTEFDVDGQHIRVEQGTSCSCSNVYYSMSIYIDGQKIRKDIRFIKSMLKKAENIAA